MRCFSSKLEGRDGTRGSFFPPHGLQELPQLVNEAQKISDGAKSEYFAATHAEHPPLPALAMIWIIYVGDSAQSMVHSTFIQRLFPDSPLNLDFLGDPGQVASVGSDF